MFKTKLMPKYNTIIHIKRVPQTKHLENFNTTGGKKTPTAAATTKNPEQTSKAKLTKKW